MYKYSMGKSKRKESSMQLLVVTRVRLRAGVRLRAYGVWCWVTV